MPKNLDKLKKKKKTNQSKKKIMKPPIKAPTVKNLKTLKSKTTTTKDKPSSAPPTDVLKNLKTLKSKTTTNKPSSAPPTRILAHPKKSAEKPAKHAEKNDKSVKKGFFDFFKRRDKSDKSDTENNENKPSIDNFDSVKSSIFSFFKKNDNVVDKEVEIVESNDSLPQQARSIGSVASFAQLIFSKKEKKVRDADAQDQSTSSEEEPGQRTEESRNVWSVDDFQPTEDRRFAKKLTSSFLTYSTMAMLFGRLPITWKFRRDKSVVYRFDWRSVPGVIFVLQGLLVSLIYILVVLSILSLVTGFPKSSYYNGVRGVSIVQEEIIVMKRFWVPVIVFCTNITHLIISMVFILLKRKYIVRYFSYWTEVVELLRIDVAKTVKKDVNIPLFLTVFSFFAIIILFMTNKYSYFSGGTGAITILVWRIFIPAIHLRSYFIYFKWITVFIVAYVYVASKFYIIYFFYRCRLIRNLMSTWNERFNLCIFGGPGSYKKMVRSTRAYLFKDHIVTLNLIDGANHEFSVIIESYYLGFMINTVWLSFQLIRCVIGPEFNRERKTDFFVILPFVLFDFYLFFVCSLEGAMIPEMVKVAFDIVKRKGMMINKANQELWFMLSMRISFSGTSGGAPLGITAGGFFYVTKTFIILAVSFMCSYLIMLYQFDFPLDQTPVGDPNCIRIDVSELLHLIEGIHDPTKYRYDSACNGGYSFT